MKKNKKGIAKSITVGVSPKAYSTMVRRALVMKPRLNLRQYINVINSLPKEI